MEPYSEICLTFPFNKQKKSCPFKYDVLIFIREKKIRCRDIFKGLNNLVPCIQGLGASFLAIKSLCECYFRYTITCTVCLQKDKIQGNN